MPKVWNKRDKNCPDDAIYVGRPSKWGNPLSLEEVHRMRPLLNERELHEVAVSWFREYLKSKPELVAEAKQVLRGHDLVCWCAPLPCHADVLLELANKPIDSHVQS